MLGIYSAFTKEVNYERDGIIIMDKNEQISPTDGKFKIDNTVDLVSNVGTLTINGKDGLFRECILYKSETSTLKKYKQLKLKLLEEIEFDNDLNCIIFKYERYEKMICTLNFISEYSFVTNKIKPRIDKTDRYYYRLYKKNPSMIVGKSNYIHLLNKIPPIEAFRELNTGYEIDKIKNILSNEDPNNLNYGKRFFN